MKLQQNMENEENIDPTVRGKRAITSIANMQNVDFLLIHHLSRETKKIKNKFRFLVIN